MRPPASASPSIGPHNRPQHGRQQRDEGHWLAAHALLIVRDLSLMVRMLKPVDSCDAFFF